MTRTTRGEQRNNLILASANPLTAAAFFRAELWLASLLPQCGSVQPALRYAGEHCTVCSSCFLHKPCACRDLPQGPQPVLSEEEAATAAVAERPAGVDLARVNCPGTPPRHSCRLKTPAQKV
jgi:hypothetical protein